MLNKILRYGLISLMLFYCSGGNYCQKSPVNPSFDLEKQTLTPNLEENIITPPNNSQDPPLVIIQYEELDKKTGKLINKLDALEQSKYIKIAPTVSSFTIHFSLLDNFFSSNNSYAYKIEGMENNWNEIAENYIRIYNLPYGNYTLLIKGQRFNGEWSSNILTIPIEVTKPFYLSWWFFMGISLGVLTLSFLFFKSRLNKLEKAKTQLEYLVALRTKKIEEDKITIQQQYQKVEALNQTKDKLFAIIAHDLKDPANTFIGLSKKIRYLIDNQDWKRLESFGSYMEHTANSLHKMLTNLLAWASTQRGTIICKPEFFSLNQLIAELLPVYETIAKEKELTINTKILAPFFLHADREMVAIVLRNLLDNALKFSKKGDIIYLSIIAKNKGLDIIIEDKGIGIPKEMLSQLFLLNQKTIRNGTAGEKGSGLGLLLCKELTELNKGKIQVESHPFQGTKFIISFPQIALSESFTSVDSSISGV